MYSKIRLDYTPHSPIAKKQKAPILPTFSLEVELIQTQMTQKYYFTVASLGSCVNIYLTAFELLIAGLTTGVLVEYGVRTSIIPSATILLPQISSVAWAFLKPTVTFIIGFFVGLATSHVCP